MSVQPTSRVSRLADSDQPVSFAELFFDLVFVYAVTQTVTLFHGGLTFAHGMQAMLVFWLIWWGWTQFTWALNAGNTDHRSVVLLVLLATGAAFFMATGVPAAFSDRTWWFGVSYVAVRGLGLLLYAWVAAGDQGLTRAVRTFATLSVAGLAAVLAGSWLGGTGQYIGWSLAIVLDILAAGLAGRDQGWNIHPRHFAERHGLFVIIALGESLIAVAGKAADGSAPGHLVGPVLQAVLLAGGFWWLYFGRLKHRLEAGLKAAQPPRDGAMARDVYSLLHFPLVFGLIICTFGIEEILESASGHGEPHGLAALGFGLFLFLGATVLAGRRAGGQWLLPRALAALLAGSLFPVLEGRIPLQYGMALTIIGLAILVILEERTAPEH